MKPINKYIDHTNLKPFATEADIRKLCAEAAEHHFASVCVNPADVALAHSILKDTDVMTCTVIGFPLGKNVTAIKVSAKAATSDMCLSCTGPMMRFILRISGRVRMGLMDSSLLPES